MKLVNLETMSGPVRRYSIEDFTSWCRNFQRSRYGEEALDALATISPLDLCDAGTFNVLYACFCASRFTPDNDRKRVATMRRQREKGVDRLKAIKVIRKAIEDTLPLGIANCPPYEEGAPTSGIYTGDYPLKTMIRLDQLLLEFSVRLQHFVAPRYGEYGCLCYGHSLEDGKGYNRKPEPETMLMFHLTLLFRLWPLSDVPQSGLFLKKMPKTGTPRYAITAKLVTATFPPEDEGHYRQIIEADTVRNRLKALPPDLRFMGW